MANLLRGHVFRNCGIHQSGKKTAGREERFSLVVASGRGPGLGLGRYDFIGRRNVDNRGKPTFCNKTSLSPRSGGDHSQSESRHEESLLNGRCPREAVTPVAVAEAELRRGQRNTAGCPGRRCCGSLAVPHLGRGLGAAGEAGACGCTSMLARCAGR